MQKLAESLSEIGVPVLWPM
ncbi:hypothetical protein ACLK1T_08535 [Escherichia coli]